MVSAKLCAVAHMSNHFCEHLLMQNLLYNALDMQAPQEVDFNEV